MVRECSSYYPCIALRLWQEPGFSDQVPRVGHSLNEVGVGSADVINVLLIHPIQEQCSHITVTNIYQLIVNSYFTIFRKKN